MHEDFFFSGVLFIAANAGCGGDMGGGAQRKSELRGTVIHIRKHFMAI